jgi:hypothetical protein
MREFMQIINEAVQSMLDDDAVKTVVVHVPLDPQAAQTWLDRMADQYGIEYQPALNWTHALGRHPTVSDYTIRGDATVVDKIERALHRFADERATPDDIVFKVGELTLGGGLPVRDAISHCAQKFDKTPDEIMDMIAASRTDIAFDLMALLSPEVVTR